MAFGIQIVINALALAAAVYLVEGITVTGKDDLDQAFTLAAVGVIFGLVNTLIKPVIKVLALPFIVLTLGLLLLVINASMLMLTSRLAESFDLGFRVDEFWWSAVFGAIIVSIASGLLAAFVPED